VDALRSLEQDAQGLDLAVGELDRLLVDGDAIVGEIERQVGEREYLSPPSDYRTKPRPAPG